MFDTMTATKIIGALCGTFLVFLLGNMVADSLYNLGEEEGEGEGHAQAYVIEAGEETAEATEEGPSFDEALQTASAEKGAKVFSKCKACHSVDAGKNGVGPTLFGVVGRDIGTEAGFSYSSVLTSLPGDWTPEALNEFLTSPKAYASGTKMTFSGLKKLTDRANLVSYLESVGG